MIKFYPGYLEYSKEYFYDTKFQNKSFIVCENFDFSILPYRNSEASVDRCKEKNISVCKKSFKGKTKKQMGKTWISKRIS